MVNTTTSAREATLLAEATVALRAKRTSQTIAAVVTAYRKLAERINAFGYIETNLHPEQKRVMQDAIAALRNTLCINEATTLETIRIQWTRGPAMRP